MKKIIALLLCLATVCTLSVTAFAAEKSPEPLIHVYVIIRKCIGVSGVTKTDTIFEFDEDKGYVTVKADPDSYGTFNGWRLYKITNNKGDIVNSETEYVDAVLGKDFEIISGDLNSKELQVRAIPSGIIICANYNGEVTNPLVPSNQESESPKTGDMAVCGAFFMMILACGIVYKANKIEA